MFEKGREGERVSVCVCVHTCVCVLLVVCACVCANASLSVCAHLEEEVVVWTAGLVKVHPQRTRRCWRIDKTSCHSQPCVVIRSSTSKDWIMACCLRSLPCSTTGGDRQSTLNLWAATKQAGNMAWPVSWWQENDVFRWTASQMGNYLCACTHIQSYLESISLRICRWHVHPTCLLLVSFRSFSCDLAYNRLQIARNKNPHTVYLKIKWELPTNPVNSFDWIVFYGTLGSELPVI